MLVLKPDVCKDLLNTFYFIVIIELTRYISHSSYKSFTRCTYHGGKIKFEAEQRGILNKKIRRRFKDTKELL